MDSATLGILLAIAGIVVGFASLVVAVVAVVQARRYRRQQRAEDSKMRLIARIESLAIGLLEFSTRQRERWKEARANPTDPKSERISIEHLEPIHATALFDANEEETRILNLAWQVVLKAWWADFDDEPHIRAQDMSRLLLIWGHGKYPLAAAEIEEYHESVVGNP